MGAHTGQEAELKALNWGNILRWGRLHFALTNSQVKENRTEREREQDRERWPRWGAHISGTCKLYIRCELEWNLSIDLSCL